MGGHVMTRDPESWIDTPEAVNLCKGIIASIDAQPKLSFYMLGEYMRAILQVAASGMDACGRANALRELDGMVDGHLPPGGAQYEDESDFLRKIYKLAALAHFHNKPKSAVEGETSRDDD